MATIGFGRPEVPGWIDTRVFQYPGAGGVLLHDDVGQVIVFKQHERHLHMTWEAPLEPGEHYIPVKRYDVDSILAGLELAHRNGPKIRKAAFAWVQAKHTYVQRVDVVLDFLGLS